jgi:predicted enzyme related to lactoylglutathione lyase
MFKEIVSGMGYFATYMDTENNTFSLWKLTECKVSNAIVAND